MGEVAVLFRLMPRDVGVDMKAIASGVKANLPAGVVIRGMQVKEIAFGLQALLVSVVMPDVGGVLDSAEQALAKVPNVESVEVMEEGLI